MMRSALGRQSAADATGGGGDHITSWQPDRQTHGKDLEHQILSSFALRIGLHLFGDEHLVTRHKKTLLLQLVTMTRKNNNSLFN